MAKQHMNLLQRPDWKQRRVRLGRSRMPPWLGVDVVLLRSASIECTTTARILVNLTLILTPNSRFEFAPAATTTVMLELATMDSTAASRVWLYAPAGMPRLSVTTAGLTAFCATQSSPDMTDRVRGHVMFKAKRGVRVRVTAEMWKLHTSTHSTSLTRPATECQQHSGQTTISPA